MTTILIIIVIAVIVYFLFSSKASATTKSVDLSEPISYFLDIIEDYSHFLAGYERNILFFYDYSSSRIVADITVRDAGFYVNHYPQYFTPGARLYIGDDGVYKTLFGDYRPHSDNLIDALGSDGKKDGDNLRMAVSRYCIRWQERAFLEQLLEACKQHFPNNTNGKRGEASFWVFFE